MKRMTPVAIVVAMMLSYLGGYVTNHKGGVAAQQRPPAAAAAQPAAGTARYAQITLAPDKGETYHWAIDELRKAHASAAANPRFNLADVLMRPITRTHMFNFRHSAQRTGTTEDPDGEEHVGVSELHIIVGGSATAYMGGELENKRSAAERPGEFTGKVKGAKTFQVKAGDIVNVPPNTPHAYAPDVADGITYMLVKINIGIYPWSLVAGSN